MRRVRLQLILLASVEVGALAVLHRLPGVAISWHDVASWLTSVDPVDAVAAVLRLVGTAVTAWLLVATLLAWASTLRGIRLVPSVAWLVPTPLRRLAARAVVGASLGGALLTGVPAGAQVPPPPADRVVVVEPDGTLLPPGLRPPRPDATTVAPPSRPAAPPPRPAVPHLDERTVRPGEHLWSIARDTVAVRSGTVPSVREVARYWTRLVAVNRDRLRSGDPDLIHPGERLHLPPGDGVDTR